MTSAAQSAGNSAKSGAKSAANSRAVKTGARVGIFCYGITYLLVAWLALQLAFGTGGQSADQNGAFQVLAEQPFGQVLLWILVIGFVAVALWRLEQAIWGYTYIDDNKKKIQKKVSSGIKVVLFAVLAVLAARTATGSGGGGGGQQQATAGVLGLPGGQILVGIAALAVIAYGVKKVVDGVKKKFLEDMSLPSDQNAKRVVHRTGQIGFIAKGITVGIIGILLGTAAVRFNPQEPVGLDGALHALAEQPFGWVLLTVMAIGLAAYGVFCFFDARYHRV